MPANWSNVGQDALGGASIGTSILPGVGTAIGAGLGGLLGLFQGMGQDDNSYLLDPNSAYYRNAQNQYFRNLLGVLNSSTPGTSSLIGASMSRGGDYGGSSYLANEQSKQLMNKNSEYATQASGQFASNLFSQGLGYYGQQNLPQREEQNSLSNNLLGLGGGLLSRYLGQGSGNNNGFNNIPGWDNSSMGHSQLNMNYPNVNASNYGW